MQIERKSKKIKLTNFVKAIGLSNKEIFISDGIVLPEEQINQKDNYLTIDSTGCIISPGFIDPQVNGFESCNFWDLKENDFKKIDDLRLRLVSSGVVAFCPTIITAPND